MHNGPGLFTNSRAMQDPYGDMAKNKKKHVCEQRTDRRNTGKMENTYMPPFGVSLDPKSWQKILEAARYKSANPEPNQTQPPPPRTLTILP